MEAKPHLWPNIHTGEQNSEKLKREKEQNTEGVLEKTGMEKVGTVPRQLSTLTDKVTI